MEFDRKLIDSPLGHAVLHALTVKMKEDEAIDLVGDGKVDVSLKLNNVEVDPFSFYKSVEDHMDKYIMRQAEDLIKEKAEDVFNNLYTLTHEVDEMYSEFKDSVKAKFKEKGFDLDYWEN